LNKLKSLKPHGGVDRALLSFDLTVDLRPAFHWYVTTRGTLWVFIDDDGRC
jgi:hypothetical protein